MSLGKKYLKDAYYAIYQNDFQKAITAFKMAIKCEPNNDMYYYKLSITYSRNAEIKDAIVAATKALELKPNNQNYRYHLQILQSKYLVQTAAEKMKKGELTQEIENELRHAKHIDPLNYEAILLLGMYYAERGFLRKALSEFNLILYAEPTNQEAKKLKEYYIKLFQEGEKND